MPLSVDVKEVAPVVPNPVPDVAVKGLPDPHGRSCDVLCSRPHSSFSPTPQVVIPFMSPVTIQLKVKVSSGQVGRGTVNCPATSPGEIKIPLNDFLVV